MTGKTGIEFCYYKKDEFNQLTKMEKDELREHHKANGNYQGTWTGKGGSGPNSQQMTKGKVAALICEHDEKKQKEA